MSTKRANRRSQTLKNYHEGTFLATLTGCTTSPTASIRYVKHGKFVHFSIPGVTGTSNSTACTLTGVPPPLRPTATRKITAVARYDNGVQAYFPMDIDSTGTMTLYSSMTGTGGFTALGTKGISAAECSYMI